MLLRKLKTYPERLYDYLIELDKTDDMKYYSKLKYSMEDFPTHTLKVLFFIRDPRDGMGKRNIFRNCIRWIASSKNKKSIEALRKNLELIPHYGRWDDLICLFGTKLEIDALRLIGKTLRKGSDKGDIYKWMPREKSANYKAAHKIIKYLKVSKKDYRKMLSNNTNVVENMMCRNEWDKINYDEVPSGAFNKYKMAFYRNDTENYLDYFKPNYSNVIKPRAKSYEELMNQDKYSLIV